MNTMFYLATTFNNGDSGNLGLKSLNSWTAPLCTDFTLMFQQASSFNQNVSNLVNTSGLTPPSGCTMASMFQQATVFNNGSISGASDASLNSWDTSNVTVMNAVFYQAPAFNQPIGMWNTSRVSTMASMFNNASVFNQNVSTWDVSGVTTMVSMFANTPVFNNGDSGNNGLKPLTGWCAPKCTTFLSMFNNSPTFNQNVSNLVNTSGLTDPSGCTMASMFQSAIVFNNGSLLNDGSNNLNSWDTSKVTAMQFMFQNSFSFNQPIGDWNTSKVTAMQSMFQNSFSFNQPLTTDGNKWNVSNVTTFFNMFSSAVIFNQYIGNWNTSSATTMASMFFDAKVFNNGQTGTMDISGNLNTLSATYANSSRLLTCTGGNFTTLTSADVLIITTGSIASPIILYTSQIQTTPISDVSLVLLTAYGANILSGITSIKKQLLGTSDLSWNTANVTTINGIFSRAPYFNQRLPWDVSNVTDMTLAFNGSITALKSTFNNGQLAGSSSQPLTNASLVPWSPTKCISFISTFLNTAGFNQPMLNFVDTSGIILDASGNGVSLNSMFSSATIFNQNLNTWNVGNATNMNTTFISATSFNNGSLTNDGANELLWSAHNCPNFISMFQSAPTFNQKVNNLVNTANVIDCNLNGMFQAATLFNNGQLGTMDISGNTPFTYTDATRILTSTGAKFLSQLSPTTDVLIITAGTTTIYTSQIQSIVSDVSLVLLTAYGSALTPTSIKKQVAGSADLSWNTINVKNMSYLFLGAYYFNQNISNWNVSNVTNMSSMFALGTTASRDLFNNGQLAGSSSQPLNWTATKCTNFNSMFAYTSGFNQPITTLVDTSGVAGCSLTSMFQNTTVFNQNVGAWNVSRVTAMNLMFANTTVFNNGSSSGASDASLNWYAPNCTTFASMFVFSTAFNQPIPFLVDTSGIALPTGCSLASMFQNTQRFNQNLNSWNVSRVTNMSSMFFRSSGTTAFNNGSSTFDASNTLIWYAPNCRTFASMFSSSQVFSQPIPFLVDTSGITLDASGNGVSLASMFINNSFRFNQNLNTWNVSRVTDMSTMFGSAAAFNNGSLINDGSNNLNNWYAPLCRTFSSMFNGASAFNQSILSLVDTSGITLDAIGNGVNLSSMFGSAPRFNQNVSNWNVSRVTTMASMFNVATAFNQNLNSWNVSRVTTMASMFTGATNFNNGQLLPPDISGNVAIASYTNATSTLYSPSAAFTQDLSVNNVLIITRLGIIYISQIQYIISDASLVLLTPNSSISSGITSIKKQVAGTADLSWNTTNVTTMASMFQNAYYFNQNINTWNVSNVTTMLNMFGSSTSTNKHTFNNGELAGSMTQQLNWKASRCTTFSAMFQNNSGFNQLVPTLVDVSCNEFGGMFNGALVFNQNLNTWNVSNVTNFSAMFNGALVFNNGQSVTQTVRGTALLASYASPILTCLDASFTQDFASGDGIIITTGGSAIYSSIVASISDNTSLTLSATYPIGTPLLPEVITSIKKQVAGTDDLSWNTQSVTTTSNMFQNATYFNQRLPWNMRLNRGVASMFAGTATTFINLFNNGQILTGNTQPLYDASLVPLPNTWDFSGGTISGSPTTTNGWRVNSRLLSVTGNGITINPVFF